MPNSKRIAGLVGPTLVAMLVSEFRVGGLAIVRAHNHWARDWTVLVTLSGWFGLTLGLFRMFAAGLYQRGSAGTSPTVFMVLEGVLLVLGLVMTVKAYSR